MNSCNELERISQFGESWKQIDEFSRYWISDFGKVYDSNRHVLNRTYKDESGYVLSDLRRDDGIVKSKRVHRLVAEAFLPDWKPEWPWTVNHINGVKDDNKLVNLEMLTTQDNSRHYQTAECFKESREAVRSSMSKKMREKCADPEYVSQMSDRMKEVWKDSNMRETYVNCLYERHSDPEERKHLSDKMKEVCADPEYKKEMSERQKANWNNLEYREAIVSQNQDRIWVHDSNSERWIHRDELNSYLSNGYKQGRLASNMVLSTAGKVRINKRDGSSKFVTKEELPSYLNDGWKLGKANKQHVLCIQTGVIYDSVNECATDFNVSPDLIRSKCRKLTKTSYKLKDFDFEFYEYTEDKE